VWGCGGCTYSSCHLRSRWHAWMRAEENDFSEVDLCPQDGDVVTSV
jgi:hypothetical protein